MRNRFKDASCERVLLLKAEKRNFFIKNISDTCRRGPQFLVIVISFF